MATPIISNSLVIDTSGNPTDLPTVAGPTASSGVNYSNGPAITEGHSPDMDQLNHSKHVCFVDLLPKGSPPSAQPALKDAEEDIQNFWTFITQTANSSVDAKVASGQIESTDGLAQNNFRAKVAAWVMDNKTTWLSKTQDANASHVISYKNDDARRTLLHQLLGLFDTSEKIYPDLETTLNASADCMKSALASESSDKNMVWVMVAQYRVEEDHGTVQSTIRTLSFHAVPMAQEVMKGKLKLQGPQAGGFTVQISTSQYIFNHQIWRTIMGGT